MRHHALVSRREDAVFANPGLDPPAREQVLRAALMRMMIFVDLLCVMHSLVSSFERHGVVKTWYLQ